MKAQFEETKDDLLVANKVLADTQAKVEKLQNKIESQGQELREKIQQVRSLEENLEQKEVSNFFQVVNLFKIYRNL